MIRQDTSPETHSQRWRRLHASQAAKSWHTRRHLLDTRDLTRDEVDCVLAIAATYKASRNDGVPPSAALKDRTIATLFYENSTRTRSSFELAARNLGAYVLNLDIPESSVSKGETIIDTAQTMVSMGVDLVVQRHSSSGSALQLAHSLGNQVHVVNAGDGWNAHPTQALLDMLSMTEIRPNLSGAKVAIIGDIAHSRVARSNIWLLKAAGADIHVAGPPTLMPSKLRDLGVTVHNRLEPAIEGADFVMALRLQLERQQQGLIPGSSEYKRLYRLDHRRLSLAKPAVRVMHPGPVNHDVEITFDLAEDPAVSLIQSQVTNGVFVRMAVLSLLLGQEESDQ